MAHGVFQKKKSLFKAEEAAMPPRPKRVSVTEADGGYIVRCGDFDAKEKVAKTLAAVVKLMKEEFGSSESTEKDEDGED